ncbi:ArsA family ATPase [Ornithinimicrobium faecis]|uniref:ArsA family ATPase n=1 Tax=Ornithinimicrobium faecis TaxID=2934158 RepID=A0ABY4YVK3_9MICO|nr:MULTISPECIES: ArsA family ATPase [unclassified Ornithinimicrobium]USQ80767.1 ArsA family ATPase [Ornithinimicrobium sp. HY1793]
MSHPLTDLTRARDVLFVGGKGGVGKTAVASALGLAQARAGRPTLVVSTDPAHNLGHLWRREVGDSPVELAPLLRGLEIDPTRTTDEHLRAVRTTMRRLMADHLQGEVDKHLDLARDAPGTHEAAVLERIAEVVEQRVSGELVIFDTAPSGHTTRLIALPELMQAWTDGLLRRQDKSARFGAALRGLEGSDYDAAEVIGSRRLPGSGTSIGPRRTQDRRGRRDEEIRAVLDRRQQRFRHLREVLTDRTSTSFVIVTAAERLPVLESVELHEQLVRSGMDVAAVVINKRSPADDGDLLASRRQLEEPHVAQLAQSLPHLPTVQVPLLAGEVLGEEGLERLLAHLG